MMRALSQVLDGLAALVANAHAPAWFGLSAGVICLAAYWSLSGVGAPGPQLPQAAIFAVAWAALLLLLVPLILARLLGLGPAELGFRLGDARWGSRAALVIALVLVPLTVLLASQPTVHRAYPWAGAWPLEHPLNTAAWLFLTGLTALALEVFHRGFILRSVASRWGWTQGVWTQAALFSLAHLGAPLVVVLAALPLALVLAVLAGRSHSILYSWLVLFALMAVRDLVALHHKGMLIS